MRFHLSAVFFIPVFMVLTGCQSISRNSADATVNNAPSKVLPMAAAVQINYQDEVKLLRINQLIAEQKDLTVQQRARLFYERGLIYDRMGLSAHSRYDFNQAINIDPAYAPAYNSLGLYLLLARSYDDAFEAFDSALELSEKMQYGYLHRAIGLVQVERYDLASKDIAQFYALDKNDPYRLLWRYIIDSNIDKASALQALKEARQSYADNRYIWSLIDVIAGRKTENEFFESVFDGVYSNKELAQRLCESYFYLAQWHKISGDLNQAIHYLKLTTATNIHDFIEYKYALMELASLQTIRQKTFQK